MILAFLVTFSAFYSGCLGCFLLRTQLGFSPIFAAALLGVLITYVPLPRKIDAKSTQVIFCTGTFVAMSSAEILTSHVHLLEVSGLGALIYIMVRPYFVGIGGRMGAIALLTTLAWLILRAFG